MAFSFIIECNHRGKKAIKLIKSISKNEKITDKYGPIQSNGTFMNNNLVPKRFLEKIFLDKDFDDTSSKTTITANMQLL